MSNDMQAPENEFNNSLIAISKLRRSSLVSIFLMVGGILIVSSSLFISVFNVNLSPDPGVRPPINSGTNSGNSNSDPDNKYEILYRELRTAQAQALELIMRSSEGETYSHSPTYSVGSESYPSVTSDPAHPYKPIPNPSYANTFDKEAWAYYGDLHEAGGWDMRYFKNTSDNLSPPSVGAIITPLTTVNLHELPAQFNSDGWFNNPAIGTVKPKKKFRVLEVYKIFDRYFWVKIKLYKQISK